jgi:hypothetical protein
MPDQNTKITRGRGGKNNFPQTQPLNTEAGDNSKYIRHALANLNMPPIDISDPVQVENRLNWYFNRCLEEDMKPTVMGFCNSLGISKQALNDWKNGTYRADSHQAIILKAYRLLEELWENYMLNGKINPVSGIFLGKVHWGYKDTQELIVTPNATIDSVDVKTIEAKYAELPDYDGE